MSPNNKFKPYESLATVRKNLRVNWYRIPLDRENLRELTLRSNYQGWMQAGGHFAVFLITGMLTYTFWSLEVWWAFFIVLFCHGTVSSFFTGTAPHELGHGTVFHSKILNKVFLYLFSLIGWWNPFDYSMSHTYHHRYTMHPEADRENLSPLEPSINLILLIQLFSINLFSRAGRIFGKGGLFSTIYLTFLTAMGKTGSKDIPSQEWLQSLYVDQPDEHHKSIMWSRFLLFSHGSLLIISLASNLWVLPLIITFPIFIASWASYFTGMTQHCGLKDNDSDFRKSTRTIIINPVLEFLYWHMNWHIEHHMYASVPCYNLRKLNKLVADDMPEPRTLIGAWKEMRQIWRKQEQDQNYQFDTKVPDLQKKRNSSEDPLASSIGDLAPHSLK
jgi:fatty acid desaturase